MAETLTPGAQTVDFSVLVNRVSEDCYLALKELTRLAPEQSDSERKLSLLKYIYKTRQRLLRLLVLSKWCRQMPVVERCQQLSGTLSNHDTSFTQAADFLFYLHEGLQQARAPIYDIPTATEVLLSGTYSRLPKCIDDLGVPPVLTGAEREATLDKLDTMLRSLLLDISLPKELSGVTVADGRILLRVNGEFEVSLTVGYRGNLSLWRILHLQLLVGESTGPSVLAEHQRHALGDDLERRMAASDDPFRLLYSILHDFCTSLVMDTLFRQTGMLRQGRWKDAIRFEKISEITNAAKAGNIGQGTGQGPGPPGDQEAEARTSAKSRVSPGLKIWYWLDVPRGIAGVDPNAPPHLRIENGPDQSLVCSHQPTVLDPATDDEAEFVIDQGCIDVERLLLRAIACNIHSRLLDVRDGLKGSTQLWRVDCDVALKSSVSSDGDTKYTRTSEENSGSLEAGEEVLCVRAYGASYVSLGISIRDGRFLLRSPKTLLANSVLVDMQDALNQGSMVPVDVFLNLRSRSLLHVFASIAASFNLKIYERGALALKFPPEAPKLGGNVLVMGFPNCEDRYFLALYLDAHFMPCFRLLEGQVRSLPGRSFRLSGAISVIRSMMISTDTMPVTEDDATFSFLEEGHLEVERRSVSGLSNQNLSAAEKLELGNRKGEDMRSIFKSIAGGPGVDGSQMDFSSITDQYYPGASGAHLSRSGNPLSPSFSPLPSPSGLQMAQASQAFVGSNVTSQGPNGSFSPRSLGPPNSTHYQSNHRGVRMGIGNGVVASPGRSPMHRVLKSPYQRDQDMLQSKSPLHAGESAASPIDLDDDDISKLIDSISSKPSGILPGAAHLSPAGDSGSLSSWQQRLAVNRSGQTVKSPSMNPRTPQAKSPSVQTLTSGRGSGLSASMLARRGSPQKLQSSQTGLELTSELMELDPSSQAMQSSMLVPSPSARSQALGAPLNARPTLLTGLSPSDSHKRKRNGSDLLFSLPSIEDLTPNSVFSKKMKLGHESSQSLVGKTGSDVSPDEMPPGLGSFVGQPFCTVVAAANQGKAPEGTYSVVLLEVVRRCWLCIKNASLARQMEAMNIPFVEELGLRKPTYGLRFRLPGKKFNSGMLDGAGWQKIRLCLGKPGTDSWKIIVEDSHFGGLWNLSKNRSTSIWGPGVQSATLPEEDSHILCTSKGFTISYDTIQSDSIEVMVADLERLWNARSFAVGIRKLLEEPNDESLEETQEIGLDQGRGFRSPTRRFFNVSEGGEKKWEVLRRAFRVEAVGITSIWFTCVGMIPGIHARFVIEWQARRQGCTVHVSPEQVWPHTKYLEDYINGGDVELLLDCIRVTLGPLTSLAHAIRPARMLGPSATNTTAASLSVNRGTPSSIGSKPAAVVSAMLGQVMSPNSASTPSPSGTVQSRLLNGATPTGGVGSISQAGNLTSGPGRPTAGILPSPSLLPTDVSVILRTPYWIRIVYRKKFAVDMRCFAGDHVWLQPAPPSRSGGSEAGGSLPCPQFRPFVMDHVTVCLNNADTAGGGGGSGHNVGGGSSQPGYNAIWGSAVNPTSAAMRVNSGGVGNRALNVNAVGIPNRVGNLLSGPQALASNSSSPLTSGRSFPTPNVSMRGEYTALFGLGDDGGYGGAWVPLAALKKVLRGTLKYLGVLWLFAEFPGILRDVLGSNLRDHSEGSLLNHDPEQPALRFFIGTCVFMVSMHRQQLTLQAINYKKLHQSSQAQSQGGGPETELTNVETQEIGDFFSRRVACEPYDASRLASFVTMLTLPVPVLREFLKLIVWKKEQQKLAATSVSQGNDALAAMRAKIELCLENRGASGASQTINEEAGGQGGAGNGGSSVAKSSIHHFRDQSAVEFTLTLSLDSSNLNVIVAGGAGWLPQCVAVRLRYDFRDTKMSRVSVLDVEGSHGGRACWQRPEEWERCRAAIIRAVDSAGNAGEQGQGKLRTVAELVQTSLQHNVQLLRNRVQNAASPMANSFSSQS